MIWIINFIADMARIVLTPMVLLIIAALLYRKLEQKGGKWEKYAIEIIISIWILIGGLMFLGNKLYIYCICSVITC